MNLSLSNWIGGSGPTNANLMVVGIAPGDKEVLKEECFVGPSGRLLAEDLIEAGTSILKVYKTNVFKHRLPDDDFWLHKQIGLDLPTAINELWQEIAVVNPNCILGLGDPVLYSLAGKSGKWNGINVWRGSILEVNNRKMIFTYHPAHELHGQDGAEAAAYKPWQKYIRKFDIKRAVEQSLFPEVKRPNRLLHVCSSSSDLYRFLERYKDSEYLSVDIEAIQQIPVCIGLSFSPHEAISIPLWNLLHVSVDDEVHPKKSFKYNLEVSTIGNQDLSFIWKMLAKLFLDKKYKFIGQNFKYDENKLNSLGFYFHNIYADTMISQQCISPELPKGLAFQTSIYTEEPYYKFEGREFNPGKDKIKDLLIYNARDAAVTLEIFYEHLKEFKEIQYSEEHFLSFRMQLHRLYSDIEKVGFKEDNLIRKELQHKYVRQLVNLEKELFDITQCHINIGSPKQVTILLYETLNIPRRDGTGEEVLTALIGNTIKQPEQKRVCEIVLDWRKNDRTLNHVLAAEADYDSRMKTTYLIPGTETYRTSTGILEPPERDKKIGLTFHGISKHGDIGNDVRSMLVADNGYIILNVDQAQAEPRVCSLLSDDEETLTMLDTIDIHGLTASRIFGGNVNLYDKKIVGFEKPERFIGKTSRNAYNLGIGKHELMINVNTDAKKYKIKNAQNEILSISESKASEILKVLTRMTPKIGDVFHATIQKLLKDNRRIYGTLGASRYFYASYGPQLFKEAYAFIPQQTVTDKTKQLALKIRKRIPHVRIVVEAHDALTMLVLEKKLKETWQEIMYYGKEPISFDRCSIQRRDLVIPFDSEIGYNYKELEKYTG